MNADTAFDKLDSSKRPSLNKWARLWNAFCDPNHRPRPYLTRMSKDPEFMRLYNSALRDDVKNLTEKADKIKAFLSYALRQVPQGLNNK